MDLRHLVEARIRDFKRREKAGETKPAPEEGQGGSLETMLISEIRALRARAHKTVHPDERNGLREKATKLQTQLTVLLESTGRPLAAKLMADRLIEEDHSQTR